MPKPVSILALLLWLIFSLQSVVASNPDNPLLTSDSIILSHQGVYKFDRATLKPIWSSLAGVQTFEPVTGTDLIFVGSTQGLYALNPDNGKIVWHIENLKTLFSPTVADNIFSGSFHGELYAINPSDGTINWRSQFTGWVYSPVVLTDFGQLWVGGQTQEAVLLDKSSGALLNRLSLDQESIFSPQKLDNNHLVFNLFNGNSTVINTTTANIVAQLRGSSQPRHLSSFGDTIYRTNRDGSLIAYNKRGHSTLWKKDMVEHDLTMHPAMNGYLLLSDLDRTLILFDVKQKKEVFRKKLDGQWFSPLQIDESLIVYFLKDYTKPNQLRAVILDARST